MSANESRGAEAATGKKKQVRVSQSDVPAYELAEALRVSAAIFDNYAGDPTKPLNVASAMGLTPASSHFRQLTGAAIAYGLTEGGYNAESISLTDLAKRIHAPIEEGQDLSAKRDAFLKPRIIAEFMRKYDGHAIPQQPIAGNVLAEMGVPRERTEVVLQMILSGAKQLALTSEIKGKLYANLHPADISVFGDVDEEESKNGNTPADEHDHTKQASAPKDDEILGSPLVKTLATHNKKVFITHGKNQGFVDPIKKLLAFGELEAVVSVEKQTVSKPVPDKVMDDMRDCFAAIIHVESELVLMDKEANEHVVLNPNVLIEIGAAMALYKRKFILLVRDGVKLPSNLQGLYEVRYKGDNLDGEATIRLLEAINELKKA